MAMEFCSYEYYLDKAERDLEWTIGDLLEAYGQAKNFETKDALITVALQLLVVDGQIRAFLRQALAPKEQTN
jgi:hypothetical protein